MFYPLTSRRVAKNREINFGNGMIGNKSNLPSLKSSYQPQTFSICMMLIGSHKLSDFSEQSEENGQNGREFDKKISTK